MTFLADHIDRELVRALVMRDITCVRTGKVLDVRTCVVLRDGDGDPRAVLSQEGFRELSEADIHKLALHGVTVDTSTVKEA